jgi:hypothetical protein
MTFSNAADGRIARHLPQGIEAVGQQQGVAPHAGSGKRSLGSGVAASNYNNIIVFNELHYFLSLPCGANDTGKPREAELPCGFT